MTDKHTTALFTTLTCGYVGLIVAKIAAHTLQNLPNSLLVAPAAILATWAVARKLSYAKTQESIGETIQKLREAEEHVPYPQQTPRVGTSDDHGVVLREDEADPKAKAPRPTVLIQYDKEKNVWVNNTPPAAKQGSFLGQRVNVCFSPNATATHNGVVLRNDLCLPPNGNPFVGGYTVIKLNDGKYFLGTECNFSPRPDARIIYAPHQFIAQTCPK